MIAPLFQIDDHWCRVGDQYDSPRRAPRHRSAFDDGVTTNASSAVGVRAFPWTTDWFERAQAGIALGGCV
ncbi:MAG TPA: hypothetical protein PK640_07480, partial [Verrucomicrobiota bacterium]|nr:hypothetical protein [Verrucomicrobiota bacterium]